jgi:hypothetical protein
MKNQVEAQGKADVMLSVFEKTPGEYLLRECNNKSQVEYFLFLRIYFLTIREYISNYFSGNQMVSNDTVSSLYFPREEMERQVDKWLCLYDLIQWGWDYIMDEARLEGIVISDSPGKVFEEIIQNHAEGLLAIHQCNLYEFSPSKSYKQLRLIFNGHALLDQIDRGSPLIGELKEVVKQIEKLNQKGENIGPGFEYLYHLCMSAFNRNKDKPRIKKKYRDYKRIEGEEEKFLLKIWHPSKKAKAWKVINQEIYETS